MKASRWICTVAASAALILAFAGSPAAAQTCHFDTYVDGSLCVGLDCVCGGGGFGFDTIQLKENNLRIKFQDTSVAASFPTRDWQILINDSANGGLNRFSIVDVDGGTIPFTIEGDGNGAGSVPANSLYVDNAGNVGFGTGNPSLELHVVDGDSPALRLEQDGSAGFTPQTWDIAGNETNFFIRDVTHGSALPLRIRPDADSNAIFVDSDSNVGFGTSSPDTLGFDVSLALSAAGTSPVRLGFQSAGGDDWLVLSNPGGTDSPMIWASTTTPTGAMTLRDTGELIITGDIITTSCPAGCGPDYVFEPDYELMPLAELAAFIRDNKHLPNVPPAEEMEQGLRVNDLAIKLLEKVEELTLYTLDQQKTIDQLEARLDSLAGDQ